MSRCVYIISESEIIMGFQIVEECDEECDETVEECFTI